MYRLFLIGFLVLTSFWSVATTQPYIIDMKNASIGTMRYSTSKGSKESNKNLNSCYTLFAVMVNKEGNLTLTNGNLDVYPIQGRFCSEVVDVNKILASDVKFKEFSEAIGTNVVIPNQIFENSFSINKYLVYFKDYIIEGSGRDITLRFSSVTPFALTPPLDASNAGIDDITKDIHNKKISMVYLQTHPKHNLKNPTNGIVSCKILGAKKVSNHTLELKVRLVSAESIEPIPASRRFSYFLLD